jgi:hypothetical protein
MPYINSKDGRREALQKGDIARTAGELNYQIYQYTINVKTFPCEYHRGFRVQSVHIWEKNVIGLVSRFLCFSPNYQKYNDMTGALIRCQKELYRRRKIIVNLEKISNLWDEEIAQYEDIKIIENGDVE